jgi:hypothetical protein
MLVLLKQLFQDHFEGDFANFNILAELALIPQGAAQPALYA